ncbi:MAG: mechanosensitive ion channel family protein [Pseudomonadota bacterium]
MDVEPIVLVRDQLEAHAETLIEALPRIIGALLVFLIFWLVARLLRWVVKRVARRARMRTALADLLTMLTFAVVIVAGVLAAAAILFPSVTPGKLLTALGLGSVAVGFAFKDILENFFAGVLILLREPFGVGDHIACDDIEGGVEEITIRDTHIRRTDGQLVVVPNAALFQNPVTVRTNREFRRTSITCGVAYGENVDDARAVIERAVKAVDLVRDDVRDVQVFAKAFGASSIDFEVAWWTGSQPIDIRASRDKVVSAVKGALDDAGIEIPFPYRTLTVNEPLPMRAVDRDGETLSDAR